MTWDEFVSYVNQWMEENHVPKDCDVEYIDLSHNSGTKQLEISYTIRDGLSVWS